LTRYAATGRLAWDMQIRALTPTEMKAIASWRYPGPYSTYDVDDASVLARDHWAVTDGGELIGYCCFGEPARVPGSTPAPGTLDIGWGMAPDRVGRGDGSRFVAAIIEFASERWDHPRLRVYVLEWNTRSRKVAARNGFVGDGPKIDSEGPFVVMCRKRAHARAPTTAADEEQTR
jgi:ribosomal-protein-alanine N-acetyltransferase